VSCEEVGAHEAVGAIAIAVAAASIARGDASAALVVGVAAKDRAAPNEGSGYAVVLRSWSP
jgi:acetyl-CoA acetyltransferase